jgi:hypothetical protein
MSDNYCEYARNILDRISAIANPVTGFHSDVSTRVDSQPSASVSPYLGMMVALIIVLAISTMMGARNKNKSTLSEQ